MSGMSDIYSSLFTGDQICSILTQCDLSRVKSLDIGPQGLVCTFYKKGQPTEKANPPMEPTSFNPPAIEDFNLDLEESEGSEQLRSEMRRYELMTNDPMAFEQEMIDQQINRDSEAEAEDAEIRYWPAQ